MVIKLKVHRKKYNHYLECPHMKQISTPKAPAAIGPYSQAIRTGNLLFTSMQIPVNPETGLIPNGIDAQTSEVLENLNGLAEAAGTSMDKAVKITVYLRDMNDFQAMNEVYEYFMKGSPPARAAVEVTRIPKDVMVAMDAIFEII